jgi:hypothetical protein
MRRGTALHDLPRVADLGAAAQDCVMLLAGAQSVPLRRPVLVDAIEALPARTLDIIGRTHAAIDPMYVARLHDVVLSGDRDLVTRDGLFLADLANQAALHAPPVGMPAVAGPGETVPGLSLLLFHNASSGDNHSHWLLQTLPQLGFCERCGMRPDRLVVQPNIRAYQREVLAALGYGAERLLLRDPAQPMRFEALLAGYVDGGLVPDATMFDRQIAAFDRGAAGPRRIYVSRQDARSIRRLLNEAELIDRLRAEGFAIVVPGALTAAEEVTLFRDARLIVGPLGAGLYNTLFTRSGATIVALSDPHYVMEWLPQAAALRGHAHGWMFGVSLASGEAVYSGTHSNWIVDIDRVLPAVLSLSVQD